MEIPAAKDCISFRSSVIINSRLQSDFFGLMDSYHSFNNNNSQLTKNGLMNQFGV